MPSYFDNNYNIRIVDGQAMDGMSNDGQITSDCLVFVYTAGTKTLATIYSDANRTSKSNPITRAQFATDTAVKFWGSASSYDIKVCHADGSIGHFPGVTPQTHTRKLDRSSNDKCIVFPMVFNAGGTETDTGLDLPLKAAVYDALVEVTTTDATETVHIGLLSTETNGDADGFLASVSVASSGFVAPIAYTTGSNETYLSLNSYGVLIASGSLGNDVATDVGSLAKKFHVVDGSNATSISYTPSSSDTFAGYGYVFFKHLR